MTFRRLFIGALAALCALWSPLARANTTTTNLGLNKPAVGGDSDLWGTYLNANADVLDGEYAVTAKGDTSYTILSTDRVIRLTTTFTAGRTFTLPAASALKASQAIVITDPVGAVSSADTLTLARAGSDTIVSPTVAGANSYIISVPRKTVVLRSDGASKWTVVADNRPDKPAFLAYLSADQSNVTGDGTTYTIPFDTEVFDLAGNFDTGTGIFTAPIAGIYRCSGMVKLRPVTTAHTRIAFTLVTTARSYSAETGPTPSSTAEQSLTISTLADMAASDTAQLQITISNSTKTVAVEGINPRTSFSCELVR